MSGFLQSRTVRFPLWSSVLAVRAPGPRTASSDRICASRPRLDRGAARRALLEPLVVAAVDLDELAAARPAAPGLLDPRLSTSPRHPQAVLGHPLPERLDRQREPVLLRQLLVGQRRTKALVPRARRGQRLLAPSRSSARRSRRTCRLVKPTIRAASTCVSRCSITRSITRTRSSSSSLMLTVSMAAVVPRAAGESGHLYFGETGHFYFATTSNVRWSRVTSTSQLMRAGLSAPAPLNLRAASTAGERLAPRATRFTTVASQLIMEPSIA